MKSYSSKSLTDEDLVKIVDLLVGAVNEVMKQKKLSIVLRPEVSKWIVDKTCHDRSYGARPLRRAIQKYIEDPLSEAIIQNRILPDSAIEIYLNDDSLYYIPGGRPERFRRKARMNRNRLSGFTVDSNGMEAESRLQVSRKNN